MNRRCLLSSFKINKQFVLISNWVTRVESCQSNKYKYEHGKVKVCSSFLLKPFTMALSCVPCTVIDFQLLLLQITTIY